METGDILEPSDAEICPICGGCGLDEDDNEEVCVCLECNGFGRVLNEQ